MVERALLAAALLFAAPTAISQDACAHRGDLDANYCDENKDLVADAPKDARRLKNPGTLVFAYTPIEDPAVYQNLFKPFQEHLAACTGKKVVYFTVQSNAAQIEAMRAGRLHIAGFNTGSNPIAVNCAGFVPFAMMASNKGEFGYEMELIVQADGPIKEVKDIKGKTLAFTSPTSNSGFKAPSALLKSDFGLEADKDYKTAFSGKHDNSILGVANKDYDAAAIANSVKTRMVARKVVDGSKLRVIYRSETFPTTGYGHVYNLKPELAAKVKEAFFTFPWEGSELLKEFVKSQPPAEKFVEIAFKKDWAVIRKFDELTGVKYECKS